MPAHSSGAARSSGMPLGIVQHVILVDGDAGGIAAIGRRLAVALIAVIGERHARLAILLLAGTAGLAAPAGIDEAADADDMTGLPFLDMVADLDHPADDLVARHHGKDRAAPFVAGLVDVGMADAAIENVDQDIVRAGLTALDRPWRQGRFGRLGGIGWGLERVLGLNKRIHHLSASWVYRPNARVRGLDASNWKRRHDDANLVGIRHWLRPLAG